MGLCEFVKRSYQCVNVSAREENRRKYERGRKKFSCLPAFQFGCRQTSQLQKRVDACMWVKEAKIAKRTFVPDLMSICSLKFLLNFKMKVS